MLERVSKRQLKRDDCNTQARISQTQERVEIFFKFKIFLKIPKVYRPLEIMHLSTSSKLNQTYGYVRWETKYDTFALKIVLFQRDNETRAVVLLSSGIWRGHFHLFSHIFIHFHFDMVQHTTDTTELYLNMYSFVLLCDRSSDQLHAIHIIQVGRTLDRQA